MKKLLLTLVLLSASALAQQTPAIPPVAPVTPATNLDAFLSQTGILTIRESLGTKSVAVLYGGRLSIEAVKVYSPGREANPVLGIAFSVNDGERYSSNRIEFIEQGEIGDMIKAIEYMVAQASKLNTAVSPELKFTSKSDAVVGMFYSSSNKSFTGFAKASTQTVYIELTSLTALGQALKELQNVLK